MSYKQYNYTGADEIYNNFSGRYTRLTKTSTGVIFNSSSDRNAKVSGMLLAEKIQGYQYKTYVVKVVAASITPGAMPYIYTGFSQAVAERVIIGPPGANGVYKEYSVKFTIPDTQLFDIGVLFSHKNVVMHSVAVNSISLYCVEDDFYVLTHKDSEIDSIKNFSGDNITAKKIIVDQIYTNNESVNFPNITCDSILVNAEVIAGSISSSGIISSDSGFLASSGALITKNIIMTSGGYGITGTCNINITGGINASTVTTNGGNIITNGGNIITTTGNITTTNGNISTFGGDFTTTNGDFTTTSGTMSAANVNAGSITSTGQVTINHNLVVNPVAGVTGMAVTSSGKTILYNGLNLNGPLTVINGAGATGAPNSTLCVKGITGMSSGSLSSWKQLYYDPVTGSLAYVTP
jgi:hypothetical protein